MKIGGNGGGNYEPIANTAPPDNMPIILLSEHGTSAVTEASLIPTSSILEVSLSNKASWFSCYANLTSTIIGAGVLGMPYAYANLGWYFGLFIITFSAISSGFALYFLSLCAKKNGGPSSFYSVAEMCLPSCSCFIIDALVLIKCFGVGTSYLLVIGDLMPSAMGGGGGDSMWTKRTTYVTIAFIFVSPICFFPSLDALKYTSSLSVVFAFFLSLVVVAFAFPDISGLDACLEFQGGGVLTDPLCVGNRVNATLNKNTLHVISIVIFSFTCQQNIFSICNEIVSPTQTRINTVISSSIFTAYAMYIIVATFGYYTFGDAIASDLLLSYPNTSIISAARVFVSLIVLFHYPLQV